MSIPALASIVVLTTSSAEATLVLTLSLNRARESPLPFPCLVALLFVLVSCFRFEEEAGAEPA